MVSVKAVQKVFILVLVVCLFYILLKLWHPVQFRSWSALPLVISQGMHQTERSTSSQRSSIEVYQAPKFAHFFSCPACFSYKMCREKDMRQVIFHGEMPSTHNAKIVWKKAILNDERVLISSPIQDEWNKFDEFVCLNASQSVPCDISTTIRRTYLGSDRVISLEGIRALHQLHDSSHKVHMSACASARFLEELKQTFDDDFDGYLSKEEQVMMLTGLLMHPGYVVAKFQARSGISMPIPGVVGACGRSVVLEGGLSPLVECLTESFDVRSELAVKVLQLVEDFEHEDPQWYFVHTDFTVENLAVTKTGDVIVLDLSELVVLDKSISSSGFIKMNNKELCNIMCFQRATQRLLYSSNASVCTDIAHYGQLMYAIICKQVLSNLKEHKAEGSFNFDGHRVHKRSKFLGLLHSIPLSSKDVVEDLLRECVQETQPGGRSRAVNELRDVLKHHRNSERVFKGSSSIRIESTKSEERAKQDHISYVFEDVINGSDEKATI